MAHRFFANQSITGSAYLLEGDQAHHLINVMRFGVGAQIVVFDGSGTEFDAEIQSIEKRQVLLRIIGPGRQGHNRQPKVTIATALPKGDRQKFMVEKLVELGASALIPLKTKRGVAEANDKVKARMKKQVIEASKQCGRNRLMEIRPSVSITELVESSEFVDDCRLFGHPYTNNRFTDVVVHLSGDGDDSRPSFVVAIGPEGGFTESEQQLLMEAEWQPVRLGANVLRIETAAIAAAVLSGQ